MIYVAFSAILALALTAAAAFRAVDHLVRAHARERNLMLNQLLHLAGRTWQPPPTSEIAETVDEEAGRYIYAPSQLLDDED